MEQMVLEVETREELGTGPNRRLRASGELPAVVYGGGKDPVAIKVDRVALIQLLKKGGGENAVFLLRMRGTEQNRHTMVRKIDLDPVSRQILHVDFQRVLLDQKVKVQVAIELAGEAVGVKTDGGIVDFVTREVEVECLPTEIPQAMIVDITDLHLGQHLEIKDLEVPEAVEILDDPQRVIVSIAQSRVAESLEEAEAEGEEELLEAAADEPEVIGREGGEDSESEGASE